MRRIDSRPIPAASARYPPRCIIAFAVTPRIRPHPTDSRYIVHTWAGAAAIRMWCSRGRAVEMEEIPLYVPHAIYDLLDSTFARTSHVLLIAHGLCETLTLSGLWSVCERRHWQIRDYVIDDPPTIIRLKRGPWRLTICDTRNWFNVTCADMCTWYNLPTPSPMEPSASLSDATDIAMMRARPVARVAASLLNWCHVQAPDTWGATAASHSWRLFTRHYQSEPIYHTDDPEVVALERQAYYGGRTECWRVGVVRGPIYSLDANNLYGWSLASGAYPTRPLRLQRATRSGLRDMLRHSDCGVAEVQVKSSVYHFPRRANGVVDYVTGRAWTCQCGPELAYINKVGDIIGVGRACIYETGRPFCSFVESITRARIAAQDGGDRATSAIAKCCTTRLYGRFAARSPRWTGRADVTPYVAYGVYYRPGPNGGEPVAHRAVGWASQMRSASTESETSNVAIAAYCTSYARLHMDYLARVIGRAATYYEDTDALHTDGSGLRSVGRAGWLSATRLGGLKIQHVGDDAEYHGPRDYRIGELAIRAGMPRDEWVRAIPSQVVSVGQRLDALLQRPPVASLTCRLVTWQRRERWRHGRIIQDGIVHPIVVNEDTPRWDERSGSVTGYESPGRSETGDSGDGDM